MGFREVMRVFWPYYSVYVIVLSLIGWKMFTSIGGPNPAIIGRLGLLALTFAVIWMWLVGRRSERYWDERNKENGSEKQ
jgi:hypothetical protein